MPYKKNVESALVNLQQAIKHNPSYREDAAGDIDFDDINNDTRFQQLIHRE